MNHNNKNTKLECISTAKLDVIFGIDVSYTVNLSENIQFLEEIIRQDMSLDARIGIAAFAATTNFTEPAIGYWDQKVLIDYLYHNISTASKYAQGNTGPMIVESIQKFSDYYIEDRQQILIIFTDGTAQGSKYYSLCQLRMSLRFAGIKTIVVSIPYYLPYGYGYDNSPYCKNRGSRCYPQGQYYCHYDIVYSFVNCIADNHWTVSSDEKLSKVLKRVAFIDALCPVSNTTDLDNNNNNQTKGLVHSYFCLSLRSINFK